MLTRKHITALGLSLMLPAMLATAHADNTTPALKLLTPNQAQQQRIRNIKRKHHTHAIEASWRRALRPTRDYSTDDARILAQAGILKYGDKAMKVGDISSFNTPKGRHMYKIQILGKNKQMIRNLIMNPKNGRVRARRLK